MNVYELLGRREVELANVNGQLSQALDALRKLKTGEMTLDAITFNTPAPVEVPVEASVNGSLPEAELAYGSSDITDS